MIELPDFKKAFLFENNFYWASDVNRLAKVLAHYELFKMSLDVPGAIVECGVFKGASFIRFATFRQFFVNPASKKMIGFDAFGEFPVTGFEADKKMREKFIADSGEQGISVDQLMEVLKHKGVEKNVELVQGDVNMTIPEFVKKYPSLKISLLNIDVDVYEATKTCLEYFYPMVTKGGVVILDDYDVAFPGANKAVDDYFKGKKSQVKRLPFSITPCYLIKEED